jgi:hypothetical protein
MVSQKGEAAIQIPKLSAINELAWLQGAVAVSGAYGQGAFKGALGKVLGTENLGAELRSALRKNYGIRAAE